MILVDTGPLIALIDNRDGLHKRAIRDLKRLRRRALRTCAAVLTEVSFALPERHHRQRLREILARFDIRPFSVGTEDVLWDATLDWLATYSDHDPDWTDGYIAILSEQDRQLQVWTYDTEFRDVWRRPDGTQIPLAVRL